MGVLLEDEKSIHLGDAKLSRENTGWSSVSSSYATEHEGPPRPWVRTWLPEILSTIVSGLLVIGEFAVQLHHLDEN